MQTPDCLFKDPPKCNARQFRGTFHEIATLKATDKINNLFRIKLCLCVPLYPGRFNRRN